ncbi:NACHT domain-containing protein [Streptomyces mirabilis]|uniref:NACHT domain-containing protein n=1 Tax=Streptomyces mirabilis TaxID=68239 RepID=A0ABU3V6A5_9ACTN|nr:NACHT domain-containing protein [Streptomyces mirabilis]MDU9001685.1 NACHT domain-containing protein [Streptomyces mirabilis]
MLMRTGAARGDGGNSRRGQRRAWALVAGAAAAVGLIFAKSTHGLGGAGAEHLLGVGGTAVGLVVGVASLWMSWLGYRADRSEHADSLGLTAMTDELALAVRAQWQAEARVRRLDEPYALAVPWRPAHADLVEPWDTLVRTTTGARADRAALPPAWAGGPEGLAGSDAEIVEVFTARVPGRRLLILGEPGGGKTMMLVRLLLGLLPSREPGSPVPVIFPLASWDPDRLELDAWLAERLATDYPGLAVPAPAPAAGGPGQVTSRARALLDQRLIIPLLDGLDELPAHTRAVALDAVNRALPPGTPLVLTSRTAEYRTAVDPPAGTGVPVRLTGAAGIELRAVDPEEAAAYLRRDAGGEGTPSAERWRPVLSPPPTDTPVGQALCTPLMLFLARTIYNPRPGERPAAFPDPAELCDTTRFPTAAAVRAQLFDGFIPAAYRPLPGHPVRWTSRQALHTLTFLARHLEDNLHGGADLAWWQLRLAVPKATRRLLAGAVLGVVMSLLTQLSFGLDALENFTGANLGLLIAFYDAGTQGLLWLLGWEGSGCLLGWDPACPRGSLSWLYALACAAYLVVGWLLSYAFRLGGGHTPAARSRWSWNRHSLFLGIGAALLVGTVFDLVLDRVAGIGWGAVAGLVCWLTTAWNAAPADLGSVTSPPALLHQDRKTFWGFLRTGVLIGLLAGLMLNFLVAYVNAGLQGYDVDLTYEAVLGCGFGSWSGLVLGLAAALHRTAWGDFTLSRLYLAARHRGALPRHLMAFLADAHQVRGVLRQVGPVYQFRHIDLQRRLARHTEAPPLPAPARATPPEDAEERPLT